MVYLFHGKNNFLSLREAKSLLAKLRNKREKSSTGIEIITTDASTEDIERIINEIETPSFLNSHKIILLKRPTQNKKNKEKIMEWLIGLTQNSDKVKGVDVIIWEDQKVRSNTKFAKAFSENKKIWESPELNKRTFITWAREQIENESVEINSDALQLLIQRSNYEPERFFHELEKIKLLGKRKIDIDDIEDIAPDTLEHTIWDLIDDINDGKKELVGERLNELFTQGNDPHFVLSMLSRNIRIILMTKVLSEEGLSSAEIAKKTGNHPFVIAKIKRKALKMEMTKIKKMYEKLVGIDYSTKTGQIDIELALNLLVSVI